MRELPSLLDGPHDEPPGPAPLRVLSACSGVGGLDLGLHRAGLRTVGLCEFDDWRPGVLARHWGADVPCWPDLLGLADEAEADPDAVRDRLGGQPDVLAGGTPCQDLSAAGKRAGLDGSRSSLFDAFVRVRDALGIEWTIWENVAGAFTSNRGLDFMAVVATFVGADVAFSARRDGANPDGSDRLKYDVPRAGVAAGPRGGCCWRLLNAQHFGVPQRRRRVFVVGRLGGPCPPEVLVERQGGGGHPLEGAPPWALAARGARRGAARAGGAGAPGRAGGEGGGGEGGGLREGGRAAVDGPAGDERGGAGGPAAGRGAGQDLGQRVAGTLGNGTPGERGYRGDLDSSGAYVAHANALTRSNAGGRGFDDNAAADGQIVGALTPDGHHRDVSTATQGHVVAPAVTSSPGFAAGCGHSGGDDQALAVGAALAGGGGDADGRGQGLPDGPGPRDVRGAGAGDRIPPAREDGRAEGRRQRADADEVGQPGRERGGRPAEADADGVRAPARLARLLDRAAELEAGLWGSIGGDAPPEDGARALVRGVRRAAGSQAVWEALGGLGSFQAAALLRHAVHGGELPGEDADGHANDEDRAVARAAQEAAGAVRALRAAASERRTPQGRRSAERLLEQLGAPVPGLPPVGAPPGARDNGAGPAGPHSGQRATAVAENQRGELRESDQALSLNTNGGKPGQGYPLALIEHDGATHGLTAEGHDASEDGTGRGTPIVAQTATSLTNGSAGAPGANDQFDALVAPTLRGSVGNGGGGQKDDAVVPAGGPGQSGSDELATTAWANLENGEPEPGGPSPTVTGGGGNTMPHVLHPVTGEPCEPEEMDPPPDGRRYAACGDGVASPCSHWLGLRLRAVAEGRDPDAPHPRAGHADGWTEPRAGGLDGLTGGVPTSGRVYDERGVAPTLQSQNSSKRGGTEGPTVLREDPGA